MKRLLKALSVRLGVYQQASQFWIWLSPIVTRAARALTGRDRRLRDQYFASHSVRRLQIGSGLNNLPGWLNSDLHPSGPQVRLDATRRFPLPENSLDAIYSEHMIEHVPWQSGRAMLRECYRVMKPGATIRIVTPDLAFLVRLTLEPSAPRHQEYIRYITERFGVVGSPGSAAPVVNNAFRAWGHQFIYDEASLRHQLSDAGFEAISVRRLDDSAQPELASLAKEDRLPKGLLALESLVLEGRKPMPRPQ